MNEWMNEWINKLINESMKDEIRKNESNITWTKGTKSSDSKKFLDGFGDIR